MINAKITGVGGYVPEKVYDNAYMESIVDTNDEWITRRTGIKERHISADNEYTTDMATIAAKRAIENAGLTPEDIDLIMLATVTPDYFTPACACVVQSNLGAVNAAAFDYNAACSGFVTGLTIAEQFIKAGTYKHIVVVCADTLSKATDYKDRATCVLFGDAAGAAVVSASEEQGIIATDIGADGSSGHAITSLAYRNDDEETEKRISHRKDTIWMAGQAVMKFAVKAMADASARVVNSAGLTWDDIALVVPHQANYRIVESAVKRMGITDEKVFLNLEKYGNTSASCIPVALTEAVQQGRIKKGDKVVLVGFGGGQIVQTLLIGLVVVDGHLLHGSQDDEHIGVQQLGQQLAAEVLVDDGRGAGELAALADNGDAAAAHGDNHVTGVYQRLDAGLFHDVKGLGGGNDLAIAAAGILYHGKALGGGDLIGLLLGVEGADGLGGLLESAVVLIDEDLGNDGGYRLIDAALGQLVADGVLQVVADITLGHSAALGEGHIALNGAGFGGCAHGEVDHTALGAVAVGDDDFVAGLDEVNDGLCGLGHELELLIGGVAEGVAAEGDNNSGHSGFSFCMFFLWSFRCKSPKKRNFGG